MNLGIPKIAARARFPRGGNNLSEKLEKPRKDALRHPPDHVPFMVEGEPAELDISCFDRRIPPYRAIHEHRERNPEGPRNLLAQYGFRGVWKEEHKRSNYDVRKTDGSRIEIVENTYRMRRDPQVYPGFLESFANGSINERFVARLFPPPWKRDVPAPRISLILGALDEEKLRLPAWT